MRRPWGKQLLAEICEVIGDNKVTIKMYDNNVMWVNERAHVSNWLSRLIGDIRPTEIRKRSERQLTNDELTAKYNVKGKVKEQVDTIYESLLSVNPDARYEEALDALGLREGYLSP